jgi:hypothetical protein
MFKLAAFVLIAACSDDGLRVSNDPEVTPSTSPRADLDGLAGLERDLRELDKQIATTTSSIASTPDLAMQQSAKLQLVRLQKSKQELEQKIAAAKKLAEQCKRDPGATGCSR